jgi:hypothetical protein
MDTQLQPPDDLTGPGRDFFERIVAAFDLDDAEQAILLEAARTVAACAELERVVHQQGVTDVSSQGVRAHPALVELRQQRSVLLKLLKALGVDGAEEARGPIIRERTWQPKPVPGG